MPEHSKNEQQSGADAWQIAAGTGVVFLRAAEHVIGGKPTALNAPTHQTPVYDYIVGIVNLAFGAELLLKACLGLHATDAQGPPPWGHDLYLLWKGLPDAARAEIGVRGILINEQEMDTAFREFRTAFTDWRYIHEDHQRQQASAEGLLHACYALLYYLDPSGISMDIHLARVGSNLAKEDAKEVLRQQDASHSEVEREGES